VLAGHRPQVWVSDLFGAQQGHAEQWQVCLAHQLRDCTFAIEAGDDILAPRIKLIVLRICAICRRADRLADSTLQQYRADLDRRLMRIEQNLDRLWILLEKVLRTLETTERR